VIAQGFSTGDVTRLEILLPDVETARSATSLKWIDKTVVGFEQIWRVSG
jgi:hypothetical protein